MSAVSFPSATRLRFSVSDVALTVVAFMFGVLVVRSSGEKPPGSTGAELGMILVALPVLARRPAPLAGLAALLVADLANVAAFGEHIRCGVVLPVAAYLGFSASRRASSVRELVAVVTIAAGIGAVTCGFELGADAIPACALVLVGAILAGRAVHRRDRIAEQLERESLALQAQRDQTARLAVETERARISGDLGEAVDARLGTLLEQARGGAAEAATFSSIEAEARAGLVRMRAVLDALRPAGVSPQPSLSELDARIAASRESAILRVDGDRRALAPGIELAACRIIELLLGVLDPADAGVQVQVRYASQSLEVDLTVGGRRGAVDPGGLAAARARAAAVGGSLDLRPNGARVRLPAPSGA